MSQSVNDVVVSGRVRLARNYFDLPFWGMSNEENAQLCISRATESQLTNPTEDTYTLYTLRDMTKVDRQALMEQHLISRDLLKHSEVGAALISKDQMISIMINEEDHLRIQSIVSGFDLGLAASEAFKAEEKLEGICTFSFDPQLGYLTSCPTNTGTGLRASLMMHLPMLTRFKQMGNVNQSVAKLGLTTRGIYGEGSEALGDLYQISNQVTLGRTEDEIIEAVTAVGKQLIDAEHALRSRCLSDQSAELKDTIFRSYGLLRYAVQMDEKEFMQHWSNLRLGVSCGLLDTSLELVDQLLTTAQAAHVKQYVKENTPDLAVNQARCQIIQKYL
ncbi:MAG: ATP--guanido phosphotransferase [Clostridiales bacterium]|nr:ATP--guanido phosphotransferase [Clostridiales bacterium]